MFILNVALLYPITSLFLFITYSQELCAVVPEFAGQNGMLTEYLAILVYFVFSFALASLILSLSFVFAPQKPDSEKISAYECGFDPFQDARGRFDIRFYLVSILFIIFDLEVTFLFPWAVALNQIGFFGFWSMMAFLAILTVGFIYEWKKGALEWE